jgi:hypothetical protein
VTSIGTVSIGASFIFHTTAILGSQYRGKKPPFDGRILTVVGFRPSRVNKVVVAESNGRCSLMLLSMVEKALALQSPNAASERPLTSQPPNQTVTKNAVSFLTAEIGRERRARALPL